MYITSKTSNKYNKTNLMNLPNKYDQNKNTLSEKRINIVYVQTKLTIIKKWINIFINKFTEFV